MDTEEPWINLTGCNSCINSSVCDSLGNCILLNINQAIPEYNKRKRRLIQRIRTYGNGSVEQISAYIKKVEPQLENIEEWPYYEKTYRTYSGKIGLTKLEKMFIENLNKPRCGEPID